MSISFPLFSNLIKRAKVFNLIMNNYDKFKAIDFVNSQAFRAWVFNKETDREEDLMMWLAKNANSNREVEKARLYLNNIQNGLPEVSDEYIEDKIYDFWNKVEERNNEREDFQTNSKRIWRLFSTAASILLFLGVGWFWFSQREENVSGLLSELFINGKSSKQIERINKTNAQMYVLLPDGSKVTLEPNSTVVYPEKFENDNREVNLVGEAFFDVVKNPDQPFVVHFNELVVKVLGTSFKINANKGDSKLQVLVKTGKVSVFEKDEWQKIKNDTNPSVRGVIITANQKVEYIKETAKFEKKLIDTPEIINPIASESDFVFEETPLIQVFSKLESAYGIKIMVDENQIEHCTLTASLADEPLIEKLNLICKIIHANYEMIDGQIVMNVKTCK